MQQVALDKLANKWNMFINIKIVKNSNLPPPHTRTQIKEKIEKLKGNLLQVE